MALRTRRVMRESERFIKTAEEATHWSGELLEGENYVPTWIRAELPSWTGNLEVVMKCFNPYTGRY